MALILSCCRNALSTTSATDGADFVAVAARSEYSRVYFHVGGANTHLGYVSLRYEPFKAIARHSKRPFQAWIGAIDKVFVSGNGIDYCLVRNYNYDGKVSILVLNSDKTGPELLF
jgi:hypothetical protein